MEDKDRELLELVYAALVDAKTRDAWRSDAQVARMRDPGGYAAWEEANPLGSFAPLAIEQIAHMRRLLIESDQMPGRQ